MPPTHYKYPKNKKYPLRKRRKSPDVIENYSGIPLPKNHELRFIKLTSLALTTFLITFLSISILTPVQSSSAEGEILLSTQATGGSVSLTTSGNINLNMETGAAGAVKTAVDAVRVTSGSAGYQLYLSTQGSDNALTRDGGTETIPAGGGDSISSPAALGSDTWGFAVASTNSTSGSGSEDVVATGFDSSYPTGDDSVATSKFAKVPIKGSDVLIAKRTGSGNSVLTNVYYGARVTSAKPSGLYKNTITYTVIGNGSSSGLASVSPSRTSQLAGGEVITIATPSTATLDSLGTITATVGGQTCSNPSAYKNGSLVNVTCTTPALATGFHDVEVSFSGTSQSYVVAGGIEYYSDATNVADTMQNFTISDCAAMYSGQTITLKDARDDQVYRITKLVDNNCWMSDNLRLGSTIMDSGSIEINSSNSDYTSTAFSITSSDITTASGGATWATNASDANEIHLYARPASATDPTSGNQVGTLYNWYTATAKSGTYSSDSNGGGTEADVSVSSSICPKNWKLPPNTGNGSYANLLQTKAGIVSADSGNNGTAFSEQMYATPYSFSLPGVWHAGLYYFSTHAVYWSRTAYSTTETYRFGIDSSGNYRLHATSNKDSGASVRCVLTIPENSMQDFTTTMCNNLSAAESTALYDNRDNNYYTIAKLPDGHCWMTTNLMLGNTLTKSGDEIEINSSTSDYTGTPFKISYSDVTTAAGGAAWTPDTDSANVIHLYARPATEKDPYSGNTYGNLYNWYTATAKSGTYSADVSGGGTSGGISAESSICPKNWKLPSNTGDPSYTNLFQTKAGLVSTPTGNDANFRKQIYAAPYLVSLTGSWDSNGLSNVSYGGYYYSRTAQDVASVNLFYFYRNSGGTFDLQGNVRKYGSAAVRCVFSN